MEELVESYLQHQSLEMVAHYVRTGRRFADLSTDDLRTRWAASFKRYADTGERGDSDDYEAELSLRREKLPMQLVQDEWRSLLAKIDAVYADPKQRERVGADLVADLAEFAARIDKERKN